MDDPFANANSPRCEECPILLLDDYLGSAAGQLIMQTVDLEFALQAGVTITLKDITYPEFFCCACSLRSATASTRKP